MDWRGFADSIAAIWGYLMLPMVVTALSVLLAHVEQAARGWTHLPALPGWRGRFFAAKLAVLMLLVEAMSALLVVGMTAAGLALDALAGRRRLTGEPPLAHLMGLMARMWVATGLVGLFQLWVALRFRSFVLPLVLGMAAR